MSARVELINTLYLECGYLLDARDRLAAAEVALLRAKLALSDADEALERMRTVFMAAAPETAKNEVQRRAYADERTEQETRHVFLLRSEVVEREIEATWARLRVRSAEDSRRFTEGLLVIPSLPDDSHIPGDLRLPPLPDVSRVAADRLAQEAAAG